MRFYLAVSILLFLISSCSTAKYGGYPKAKRTKHIETPKRSFKKKVSNYKAVASKAVSLPVRIENRVVLTDGSRKHRLIKHSANLFSLAKPKGDGKPKDVTQTNKNAKRAFISSVIAIGSLAVGIFIAPIFLIVMIAFAAIAFIYSIIALKQIKRTGEYGRTKAEFALYSSIPILVLSIFGLLAYLMSNSAGIQIGNFVLR